MSGLHHRRHAPPRDPLILGVIALAVLAFVFYSSLTHSIPFLGGGGRVVHAQFASARQVNAKTPVRVLGIAVGHVESAHYDAARRLTDVAFRLTDEKVQLHDDASAALRWRTLLGGRMELALDPGSPSAPPLAANGIPLSRTRIQTELEDVARALGGRAVDGTRALLRELPKALDGPAAGRAVDSLGRGLPSLGRATRALRGERRDDLAALVRSGARATSATERVRGALGAFVAGAQQTLRVTADDRAQLGATFRRAPAALRATTDIAQAIDQTLPDLDGLVGDLRPGARLLGPVLARAHPTVVKLRAVLAEARPLLASLRPAVDRLADASGVGRRLLVALDPTVRRLADDLVPFLARPDEELHLPVYQLIGPTFSSLNAASGQYDDTGHLINFPVQPGENSAGFVPCATFVADPTASEKVRCGALNDVLGKLFGARSRR